MTSTLKIIIAVVVVGLIGFAVYRMQGTPSTDSDSMSDDNVPAATGDIDGMLSAFDMDATAEASVTADEDDTDLMTADSQAVTDLNNAYAEDSF